jgi:hypothetical protein
MKQVSVKIMSRQQKTIDLVSLKKKIASVSRKRLLTLQDKFEQVQRGRIMRLIYRLGLYDNSSHFPLQISTKTTKDGMGYYKMQNTHFGHVNPNIDALWSYKRIQSELKSGGFLCEVVTKKRKGLWFETYLVVYGIKD